jgi:uncharacterized protein (DUF433 family)
MEDWSDGRRRGKAMNESHFWGRVSVNPNIFGGKPIIRGLRIKVENVLALLEQGVTLEEILDDYPDLEPEDLRACLAYARALVANETLEAVTMEGIA